jgi:hypothetical protein
MIKYSTVDDFMTNLSEERKRQVETLRTIIKTNNTDLVEHIKWNSPSYTLDDVDRITFNTHYPDRILLVLHMGSARKEDKAREPVMHDTTGIITWNSDIRGVIPFYNLDDIETKRQDTSAIITAWLRIK